jgi:NAD(P)-dependent dehydrogenase (short-subunit alcohol dehydrogenase family)
MPMDLELRDRVAIVTGGSRGIGKAIAQELAREGCSVAVVARGKDALDAAAAELGEETGAIVVPIPADTASDAAVKAMVAAVADRFGRIDILVNNGAAVGSRVAFKLPDVTQDAFWGEMNVKVLGYLRCMQHVAPHMIERGWGRIINISGMAARTSTSIIGSARNVAVVALTKNAADELGQHGINVTVVHPGGTLTEHYVEQLDEWAKQRGLTRDEAIRQRYANNSIRQPIYPRHIAHVVAFLASPKSVAINGDVIAVAGGSTGAIHY